jgi:hypothetical protein
MFTIATLSSLQLHTIHGFSLPTRPVLIVALNRNLIATRTSPGMISDFLVQNAGQTMYIYKRQFADEFLACAAEIADVYVHSTLDLSFTQQILGFLDPLGMIIKGIWGQSKGQFGRRRVITVDTDAGTDLECPLYGTLISVRPFEGDVQDTDLKAALEDVLIVHSEI